MNGKTGPSIAVIGTGAGVMRSLTGEARPASITHPVKAAPVIHGAHGRAWLCDLEAGRRQLGVRPEDDGTLAIWIVEAPWAHPAWHSYSIVLVHLRPIPGRRLATPTKFYLPLATHELWLHALDPDQELDSVIATGLPGSRWLQPKNFAAQIVEIDDDLARERIRRAVEDICAGKLSPDTDHQRAWVDRFGNNMIKPEYR